MFTVLTILIGLYITWEFLFHLDELTGSLAVEDKINENTISLDEGNLEGLWRPSE